VQRETFASELIAEFIGTFIILAFGIAVVAQVTVYGTSGIHGTYGTSSPWAWGIAVALAIYVAGGVSGAHLNPAVTFALALRRGFAWSKVPAYWAAQTCGAFTAAALMFWNYHAAILTFDPGKTFKTQGVFSTSPDAAITVLGGFRDEVILTAIFMLVLFALLDERNQAPLSNIGPLIIGLLISAIGSAFASNSGWAINPARDFGPRLLTFVAGWSRACEDPTGSIYFWVPIIGPLVGGVLGALIYDFGIARFLGDPDVADEEVGTQGDATNDDDARVASER